MQLSVTSKRQVTFPVHVLQALGAVAGDKIELIHSAQGFLLRKRAIGHDKLGSMRHKIKGTPADFDIQMFRATSYDPTLRD